MLLRAETRLPGHAWLEITVEPAGPGTTLHQRAVFHPRGLGGHIYWAAMLVGHLTTFALMHQGMVRAIRDGGEAHSGQQR